MNLFRFSLQLMVSFTALCILFSCNEVIDVVPPSPEITITPKQGDTVTFFSFDGSGSTDNMSEIWQLQFRWDFNGDGIWDTDWSREPKAVSKFSKFGKDSVRLQVMDHAGLIGVSSRMINISPVYGDTTFMDARDGNNYRAIRIDNLWWMAEDLRYGVEISLDSAPHRDNIVEKFMNRDSLNQLLTESGYYTWSEATYYGAKIFRGICPDGWRLIDYFDVDNLIKRFQLYGDPGYYFKLGGYLGMDLAPQGFYSTFTKSFSYFKDLGFLLIGQKYASDDKSRHYLFNYGGSGWGVFDIFYAIPNDSYSYPYWWDPVKWGLIMDFNKLGINVRCVKDIAQ